MKETSVSDYKRVSLQEIDYLLFRVIKDEFDVGTNLRVAKDLIILREPVEANLWSVVKLHEEEQTAVTIDVVPAGSRPLSALHSGLQVYSDYTLGGGDTGEVGEEFQQRGVQ